MCAQCSLKKLLTSQSRESSPAKPSCAVYLCVIADNESRSCYGWQIRYDTAANNLLLEMPGAYGVAGACVGGCLLLAALHSMDSCCSSLNLSGASACSVWRALRGRGYQGATHGAPYPSHRCPVLRLFTRER